MKFLVASDLHGSSYYAQELVKRFNEENADVLVLLGDIFNHGPRNPLPKDYAPLKVAETLNGIKDSLIVIKGNCDSEVDTLIAEFDFLPCMCISIGDKKLFFSHGHVYNNDNLPKTKFDACFYGHFHVKMAEELGETLIINPGSVSLPKDDFRGYVLIDDETLYFKTIDGETESMLNL